MSIIIVDYGLGNLRSVYNALLWLGADVKISSKPSEIDKADKVILPGVGSFKDTIKLLKERDLIESIKRFLERGGLYLGICLGLQILFEESQEGDIEGLGIFKGRVRRFQKKGLKVPHMGWNQIKIKDQASKIKILKGITDNSNFYFVHSYYVEPKDKDIIVATSNYGGEFVSIVNRNNIYATQFHPEKSQEIGLSFLKNFLDL